MASSRRHASAPEDPFNLVHTALVRNARVVRYVAAALPWHAFTRVPFAKKPMATRKRERRSDKLHPLLAKWVAERKGDEVEEIVVTFHEDLAIPRFPEPDVTRSRRAEINRRRQNEAARLVEQIRSRRADHYQRIAEEFARRYGARVLETFWLISGALITIPLRAVRAVARRADVAYLEPRRSGEEPPQNPNPNDDVAEGRGRMTSDAYFDLGLAGGYIGLLDSGVRFTHVQFNAPTHVGVRRDCVNGGPNCTGGAGFDPSDDCWNHGTSSAAIIAGNVRQGADFRGVTAITLDSFKVYPSRCVGLDSTAAVRAFQAAVSLLDRVIVAEMQSMGDERCAVSAAGDAAFDAGAVVVAANGNDGRPAGVRAPANAHRVVGVGNFDVQTGAPVVTQSRGPASDGRVKPDIQCPTNTETASAVSDTAFQRFGGTSGATPYAAGAAALLRNWLLLASGGTDPGQVYAHLVLSGQQPHPFDNIRGAGPLQLPTDGWAWWGKVSVANGQTCDIPLHVSGTSPHTLDGALWWPEYVGLPQMGQAEVHNNLDLHLVDPGGAVRASSTSVPSVFERARVAGAVATGTWKLRIRGSDVFGTQTVYWAAHVRLMSPPARRGHGRTPARRERPRAPR